MNRIIVKNVSKKFNIGFKKNQSALARAISLFSGREPKKEIWALKNVSFTARAGEIIGLIGPNGSGKSTLLRAIAGIYGVDSGEIKTKGKTVSLINLNIGFKPDLTMQDNIFLCCSLFGLSEKVIKERFDSIAALAELGDFTNTKLYQFSSGMGQRLAFSIAMHCDPEILLLDEVFEVGDESFKEKSARYIKGLAEGGATVILVSHELDLIEKYCQRVLWVDSGIIKEEGLPKEDIIDMYIKG